MCRIDGWLGHNGTPARQEHAGNSGEQLLEQTTPFDERQLEIVAAQNQERMVSR